MLMLEWIRMHLKLTTDKIYKAIQKAIDHVYKNKRETGSWMKGKNLFRSCGVNFPRKYLTLATSIPRGKLLRIEHSTKVSNTIHR